jgi:hypothetical protein
MSVVADQVTHVCMTNKATTTIRINNFSLPNITFISLLFHLKMTTRNLNKTWRDIVFEQYQADLEADSPFPIRYLIFLHRWKKDTFISIPNKIEIMTFRRAILDFVRSRDGEEDPTFSNEHISVWPRKTFRERQEEEAAKEGNETKETGFLD